MTQDPRVASDHNRWIHRFSLLTAGATFVLVVAGGLVTSTGSGLAVPDWPTTFGHNMFLYPWSKMVDGILIEHGHRLIGAGVGLLTLAWPCGCGSRIREDGSAGWGSSPSVR